MSASFSVPDVRMQDCLSLGKPLLIENVEEELDPVLDPVLDRRIIRKGKSMTIALADKEASSPFPSLHGGFDSIRVDNIVHHLIVLQHGSKPCYFFLFQCSTSKLLSH